MLPKHTIFVGSFVQRVCLQLDAPLYSSPRTANIPWGLFACVATSSPTYIARASFTLGWEISASHVTKGTLLLSPSPATRFSDAAPV
eukprot:m.37530 g.37530  ORF g.37530 m.37530 type:complete len:87 (+) comp14571_c0_seq2:92-352(+)